MNLGLKNKVVIVTGAAAGLGKVSAMAFACEGAKVIVADIDSDGGQKTVQSIKENGGEAVFVKTDVTKESDVKAMVEKAVETYGRLDCAHNNAGLEEARTPLTECTEDQWDRILNVNLKSVFLCMKYEIPHMVKGGGGAIVNMSSSVGLKGSPQLPSYCAAKHGVNGITKSAALEYAKAGVRINSVCPGGMRGTPMYNRITGATPDIAALVAQVVPLGRDAEPEEVADAVLWLCSDRAAMITGSPISVDGGIVPK